MAELRILVCDCCGALDRQTTRYYIAKGASAETTSSSYFDLCEEHAAPLEQVLATKGTAQGCDRPTSVTDDLTRIADGLSDTNEVPTGASDRPDNVTELGSKRGPAPPQQ